MSKLEIMPDRQSSPKFLRGSIKHYSNITMTHPSCKAIIIIVLPNFQSGKPKKVSVFRIYFPRVKS